jgi:hypothetical protein
VNELPQTLRQAVRDELRIAFRYPYTVLQVIVLNAALVVVLWYFAPPKVEGLFFEIHSPALFTVVLAGWMFSDVPSTNVLASDVTRTLPALGDRVMTLRLMNAKRIALWLLVAPVCSVLTFVMGYGNHHWFAQVVALSSIVILPFGTLAISGWVGIIWPYHPRSLKYRWRHRDNWFHDLVRWGVLVVLPYGLVPAIGLVLLAPSLFVWSIHSEQQVLEVSSPPYLVLGIALAAAMSAGGVIVGNRYGWRLIERRRPTLTHYLEHPELG